MDEHVDGRMDTQDAGGSVSEQTDPAKPSRVMRITPPSPRRSKKQQELQALEQRLEARILDEVERRFQSAKDKRWAELEKQYGRLSELARDNSEELGENQQDRVTSKPARASTVIQPSGGGLPKPDLRAEYEKRLRALRLGDVAGMSELKREFRGRGLEVY